MQVKLKVLRGASAGKEVAIRGRQFFIGRSEECNLRANSEAISRRHCEITVSDSDVRIQDLGSRNGTFVNGTRIDGQHEIQMGDQLRIGPLEFLVTLAKPKAKVPNNTPKPSDSGVSSDEDITNWLEEGDEADRKHRLTEPETREYRVDETDRVNVVTDKAGSKRDDGSVKKQQQKSKNATEKAPAPAQPHFNASAKKDAPKDTQEAAAQMLRRFFNRG